MGGVGNLRGVARARGGAAYGARRGEGETHPARGAWSEGGRPQCVVAQCAIAGRACRVAPGPHTLLRQRSRGSTYRSTGQRVGGDLVAIKEHWR